jgi:aromatic-L-amino-acid decarboxylase
LAVINFRYNPIGNELSEKQLDALNQKISKRVMDSKEALLVTTILHNQVVLRMCLINPRTTIDDIKETLNLCATFAE